MNNTKQLSVNIHRIIDDVVYNYSDMVAELPKNKVILNPIYVIKQVRALCNRITYAYTNEHMAKQKMQLPNHLIAATKMIKILLRGYLSTKYLLDRGVINCLLDFIIQRVELTFKKSLIDYGSSVGILAAQCVSEPLTQFVLNSKHRAGGRGGTQTNEIIRVQEILGARVTTSMKNPHMLIMVKPKYETDRLKVQEISNHLEMIRLNRFITNTKIFFEQYGEPTHPDYKAEASAIKLIEKHNYPQKRPGDLANWCIRFELDNEELILKSMKLETIITAIRQSHKQIYVIYSPENAKTIFIRCYIRNSMVKQSQQYYIDNVYPIYLSLKDVIIRGIDGIIATSISEIIVNKEDNTGAMKRKKIFGVAAVGTNMNSVISNDHVDAYRTQSDSIKEIEDVFGIEAARAKIMCELTGILKGLSLVHCSIFADEMTYTGEVTSIQQSGLHKREKDNITLRLAFQMPVQVIQDAAVNGAVDHIKGISGPLVLGTTPKCGTTFNKIAVNEEFIKANVVNLASVVDDL